MHVTARSIDLRLRVFPHGGTLGGTLFKPRLAVKKLRKYLIYIVSCAGPNRIRDWPPNKPGAYRDVGPFLLGRVDTLGTLTRLCPHLDGANAVFV